MTTRMTWLQPRLLLRRGHPLFSFSAVGYYGEGFQAWVIVDCDNGILEGRKGITSQTTPTT